MDFGINQVTHIQSFFYIRQLGTIYENYRGFESLRLQKNVELQENEQLNVKMWEYSE